MTELSETGDLGGEAARFMEQAHEGEELWERRYRAMTMRNAGATYSQIGKQLGVSAEIARRDVGLVLKEFIRQPTEDAIAQHLSVLHDARKAYYPAMLRGDTDAWKPIIQGLEHEAKLRGMYAPERVQIGLTDTQFAEEAVALIASLPTQAVADLQAQAQREAADHQPPVEAEVVELPPPPTPQPPPSAWADI